MTLAPQEIAQHSCAGKRVLQMVGVNPKEIGQIGAGKRNPTGRIDVAMIQSLVRRESVADLVAGYGQVIVDECHHLPAVSFERVLASAKARYVAGLTATPQRRDGRHPITQMQLGPVRFTVNAKTRTSQRPFEHRLIVRETTFPPSTAAADGGIQGLYGTLAQDETRNAMILNDVIGALADGRSAAGHALPGIAHFLEGDRRPIHRTPASPPPRQVRSPHLRLR
jgi:hypothetical protein